MEIKPRKRAAVKPRAEAARRATTPKALAAAKAAVAKAAPAPGTEVEPTKSAFDSPAIKRFIAKLSETANVTLSAATAGVSTWQVYAKRQSSARFRLQWAEALAEGYARLEAELLAEALRAANGTIKDATLKSRAQKHRIGLTLLAAHRASVKSHSEALPLPSSKGAKKALLERLTAMQARYDKTKKPKR